MILVQLRGLEKSFSLLQAAALVASWRKMTQVDAVLNNKKLGFVLVNMQDSLRQMFSG